MRPLKSATGMANWLLRLSLVATIYLTSFKEFLKFNFKDFSYFINLLLVIFGVVFVVGAFSKRHNLTVVSSLFICILYFILLYLSGIGKLENIITYLTFICLSFFFLANGNK